MLAACLWLQGFADEVMDNSDSFKTEANSIFELFDGSAGVMRAYQYHMYQVRWQGRGWVEGGGGQDRGGAHSAHEGGGALFEPGQSAHNAVKSDACPLRTHCKPTFFYMGPPHH